MLNHCEEPTWLTPNRSENGGVVDEIGGNAKHFKINDWIRFLPIWRISDIIHGITETYQFLAHAQNLDANCEGLEKLKQNHNSWSEKTFKDKMTWNLAHSGVSLKKRDAHLLESICLNPIGGMLLVVNNSKWKDARKVTKIEINSQVMEWIPSGHIPEFRHFQIVLCLQFN